MRHKRIEFDGKRILTQNFINRCVNCVTTKLVEKKGVEKPIVSSVVGKHIQLDLTQFQTSNGGYQYVGVFLDLKSKMVEGDGTLSHFLSSESLTNPVAMIAKDADEVIALVKKAEEGIYKGRIKEIHVLQVDNALDIKKLSEFAEEHGIEIRHGAPYKPTTQGQVPHFTSF
jgi:hypothetical protein